MTTTMKIVLQGITIIFAMFSLTILHEYVHHTACTYAGGKVLKQTWTYLICQPQPDNNLEKEQYIFDVTNEIIYMILIVLIPYTGIIWAIGTKHED